MSDIVFNYRPVGKNGSVTMTARLGEETLAVETLDIVKSSARKKFAASICKDRPGMNQDDIERSLLGIAASAAEKPKGKKSPVEKSLDESNAELLERMPQFVREQARQMLESPDLLEHIRRDIQAMGVAGEQELAMTTYLVGLSRLLSKPLAAISQGQSSSGKSFIIDQVSRMFPPESVIVATQMTPRALFYMKPGQLKHRFVVCGERSRIQNDDTSEATRALREMLSNGRLSKLIPIKKDGSMETAFGRAGWPN